MFVIISRRGGWGRVILIENEDDLDMYLARHCFQI